MVSAGEASGDAHAAHALACLQARADAAGQTIKAFGMGGSLLASAGCDLVVDNRDLSVIGFVDVIRHYPEFLRRLERLREAMRSRRPAMLLIVDYPDFNLKLAETAQELNIPVLMYVAPQVWAWRAGRVKRIAPLLSHLAVLFPFEVAIWKKAGVNTSYVGHPMVQTIDTTLDRHQARNIIDVDVNVPLLALLPGSRRSEITRLVPLMVQVAAKIATQLPECRFVLPIAPSLEQNWVQQVLTDSMTSLDDSLCRAPVIDLVPFDTAPATQVMRAADVVLVASGTATLETGLVGTPMVVVYAVSWLNAFLMRRLIQIRDVALVNIVAERRIVPEFIQEEAQPDRVANAVLQLLEDESAHQSMREDLADIKRRLGQYDASDEVARIMQTLINDAKPEH